MKYITILVLFVLSINSNAQVTWALLANNQTVSMADLYNACILSPYFQIKGTFAHSSYQQITKTDAANFVYIDESNAGYSSRSSLQLVQKTDLTAMTFTTFFPHSHSTAYATSAAACGSSYTNGAIYTSTNNAPAINDIMYANEGLTLTFDGGSLWFQLQYTTGTAYVIQISATGVVLDVYVGTCTPT